MADSHTHTIRPRPARVQACAPTRRASQQAALCLGACACEGVDVESSQEIQKGLLEKVPRKADVGVATGARTGERQGGVATQEGLESRTGLSNLWMWCVWKWEDLVRS